MKSSKRQSGIAILEATGIFTILMTLIIAVFGMVQYMSLSKNLDTVLDKIVYDSAIKPFKISRNQNLGSSSRIEVNRNELESYLNRVVADFDSEFLPYYRRFSSNESPQYFVESAYAEVSIDPVSGTSSGFSQPAAPRASGSQGLAGELDKYFKFQQGFERHIALNLGESSMLAVPQANHSLQNSGERFLPATFLVGVRVGLDIEDTWIGSALKLIGSEAFLSSHKIVTLRGEITDAI